jgi:hypothetical protein
LETVVSLEFVFISPTFKPIDVIKSNQPILILDEPQKMEGKKTVESLAKFNPLMILRYSATHKTQYDKVHRLDALDAYNQKLVRSKSRRNWPHRFSFIWLGAGTPITRNTSLRLTTPRRTKGNWQSCRLTS